MNSTGKELLWGTIQRIQGAYAPATIRAYKSNFENFISFCEKHNRSPLPASGEDVADFVSSLSDGHLKSASIRLAVAAISTIHKLNRLPDPTATPEVKLEVRRMYRKLGRCANQAHGINATTLQDMLLSTDPKSLRGVRDRALLLVAYDSLCRRSELVSLNAGDVIMNGSGDLETIRLKLRRSKTDPEATGRWLYLSRNAQAALQKWLDQSGIKDGSLFRGITNSGRIGAGLCSGQVNRIYKKLAKASKLSPELIKHISGHSMRVGAAQDLLLSGATLPMIMSRGRWSKTDTVMRYVESAVLQAL